MVRQLRMPDAVMTLKYPNRSPMCPGMTRPKREAALFACQICCVGRRGIDLLNNRDEVDGERL